MKLMEQLPQLTKKAKAFSRELVRLTTANKNACLLAMADALEGDSTATKDLNPLDMEVVAKLGLFSAHARPAPIGPQTDRCHGDFAAGEGVGGVGFVAVDVALEDLMLFDEHHFIDAAAVAMRSQEFCGKIAAKELARTAGVF